VRYFNKSSLNFNHIYRTGSFETQSYYTPDLIARMEQWLAAHGQEVFNAPGVRVYHLQ
jgi:hypothetical protein